jgi:hypothetical protein
MDPSTLSTMGNLAGPGPGGSPGAGHWQLEGRSRLQTFRVKFEVEAGPAADPAGCQPASECAWYAIAQASTSTSSDFSG